MKIRAVLIGSLFLANSLLAYFIGNLLDNAVSPRPCSPQNLFLFNCPGLGLAGATPVGLMGALAGGITVAWVFFHLGRRSGVRH